MLASEVSKPGTFTMKTLRTIDELDPPTALLFERFCLTRIDNFVPLANNKLNENELRSLSEAGLITIDMMPSYYGFGPTENPNGQIWGGIRQGNYVLSLRLDVPLKPRAENSVLFDTVTQERGTVNFQVLRLTSVGSAISSILPHDPLSAIRGLREMLSSRIGLEYMLLVEMQPNGRFATLL